MTTKLGLITVFTCGSLVGSCEKAHQHLSKIDKLAINSKFRGTATEFAI